MIDYYRGIDVTDGHAIEHLEEVAARICPDDEADAIYNQLAYLADELSNRENLGHFDRQSYLLSRELPSIKKLFLSPVTKQAYDNQLQRAYELSGMSRGESQDREAVESFSDAISPTWDDDELNPASKKVIAKSVTPFWHKVVLQLVIVGIVIGMAVFLNFGISLTLIILMVLVILGLLVTN